MSLETTTPIETHEGEPKAEPSTLALMGPTWGGSH